MSKRKLGIDDFEKEHKHKRFKPQPKKKSDDPKHEVDKSSLSKPKEVVSSANQAKATKGSSEWQARKTTRAAKRERRAKRREQKQDANDAPSILNPSWKKAKKRIKDSHALWTISDALGGQMLDIDPIFALDEVHLLVAFDSSVNVYSTATSLLIRRLRVNKSDRVTAFTIAHESPNLLYISTETGSIEKWDWIEGQNLEFWNISNSIHNISTSDSTSNKLVYTVDSRDKNQWFLTAHRLLGNQDAIKTDVCTLLKYPAPLTSVRVVKDGKVIILTSGSRLIIGTSVESEPETLRDLSYIWRDVECPEWIASLDVRVRENQDQDERPKSVDSMSAAIDIAIGTSTGMIMMYDDLLACLMPRHGNGQTQLLTNLNSRRLHWHRNAVLALKWSRDGNYLISGGFETVMVIWQLETGHKQFLPHLSAPVESIVVSPSGSSYSLRLADNSVMILTTADLQPTFSVSGLQLPAVRNNHNSLPFVPTINSSQSKLQQHRNSHSPAVVLPNSGSTLLLAVPSVTSSRTTTGNFKPACYLQTFELSSGQQISRQALTRTNITSLNIGPELNKIEEPTVLYLQLSSDAQWLATIDEWLPPNRDTAPLAFDQERGRELQSQKREVHLKLWLWNDSMKTWELVSRVDSPHAKLHAPFDANNVLDLASDPSCVSFATIGSDQTVKIWKPSARRRHGKEIRDGTGRILSDWSCRQTISLETQAGVASDILHGAKLAYSPDGSILAAGYEQSSPPKVQLLNPTTGKIHRTLTGLQSGPLFRLGILGKYIITLSYELRIWDLVKNELGFGYALQNHGLSVGKLMAGTHLAIDSRHGTFAIATPTVEKTKKSLTKVKSLIVVFEPNSITPLFFSSMANGTKGILPIFGRKGYYVLDTAAEIRTLSPKVNAMPVSVRYLQEIKEQTQGLNNIYGNKGSKILKADDSDYEASRSTEPEFLCDVTKPDLEEDEAVVVNSDKLTQIFDTGSAFTLPPMTELFEQVANLFVRKAHP